MTKSRTTGSTAAVRDPHQLGVMHDRSSQRPPGFQIREQRDDRDAVRLSLSGELDLAVAEQLRTRLQALARRHTSVVLDLSDLQFIDITGIHVLITHFNHAAQNGWELRVDPNLPSQARRVIELIGLDHILWP
jgi:anti-sigma B factor antagonist